MKVEDRPIEQVVPYWRNPHNNENAVNSVMDSIERYGFNVPIVVDSKGVIIAGHTRYKAAVRLEMKTVPVYVADLTPQLAKEYRIADNKSGELAAWNMDALVAELREIEELAELQTHFGNMDLDRMLHQAASKPIASKEQIQQTEEQMNQQYEVLYNASIGHFHELMCPSCGHEFYVDKREIARVPGRPLPGDDDEEGAV